MQHSPASPDRRPDRDQHGGSREGAEAEREQIRHGRRNVDEHRSEVERFDQYEE